jgi:signal transduction histidine kinase
MGQRGRKISEEAIASHELRTSIMSILCVIELLNADYIEQNKQEILIRKEYLDIIIRNTKRLERLVEEIFDVTRLESRKFMLKKEDFILNDIIINAIDDIILNKDIAIDDTTYGNKQGKEEEKTTATRTKIVYNLKEPLIRNADKNRISQVISNLLTNAVKFTKEDRNSIIAVNAKREGNCVIVTIKDSGKGIDTKIFPGLFSKFATNSYQGVGLGLFISKKIIHAHGGKIWAENNYSDERGGSTFAFILPNIDKSYVDFFSD